VVVVEGGGGPPPTSRDFPSQESLQWKFLKLQLFLLQLFNISAGKSREEHVAFGNRQNTKGEFKIDRSDEKLV
jgi:hypothetical protein